MINMRSLLLILVPVALAILVVVFVEGSLLPSPKTVYTEINKEEAHLNTISAYLSAEIASVDQILSMLLTLQLGLFVLVGFVLQKLPQNKDRAPTSLIVLGIVFSFSSFVAIYFGYVARIEVFELVNTAGTEFDGVRPLIGRQALFLAIAGVAAIWMTTLVLLEPARPNSTLDNCGLNIAAQSGRGGLRTNPGSIDDSAAPADKTTAQGQPLAESAESPSPNANANTEMKDAGRAS